MTTERRAYTVREVAEAFGLHPDTVAAAIRRGELRATRLGRRWLVPREEVERIERGDA